MRRRHVLLGWEFGSGRGHLEKLFQAGRLLAARGHRVSYALQRVDAGGYAGADGATIWQAPLSPRLLVNTRKQDGIVPATLGDILGRLGLDDPGMVAGVLRAWTNILSAAQPDLVIGDYAPLLLTAARGRVATLASGAGFDLPPARMQSFPSLSGAPPAFDERLLLESFNRGAAGASVAPIDRLPALFAADVALPATFAEIDPYREHRRLPVMAPVVSDPPPPLASGRGEEVFVYIHEGLRPDAPLWAGLERSRLPIRAYTPAATNDYVDALERRGIAVETRPVPFPRIVERSRLLVSHGSHGFVCSGLLAGLPHVICHYDLEKFGIAGRVAGLGLGGHVPLHAIDPDPFAESLVRIYRDDSLAAACLAAAPDFRRRMPESVSAQLVDRAESLVFGQ